MQSVRHTAEFRDFAIATKKLVDERLPRWLEPRLARARGLGAHPAAVAEAASAIAIRGGKRLRAILLAIASEGCGGPVGEAITPALLAVELFHAYLLTHDDWMDEDEVRRGGPSAHVILHDRFGEERAGAVGAVLAGDLGAGYALEALGETKVPPACLTAALSELARAWVDVVLGQALDVGPGAGDRRSVEVMHDLKTNSYTVRAPMMLGALLAGRGDLRPAIEAFARPLGVAFQLRDDWLGTFGDPEETGKPIGSDLRQGKKTALIAELEDTDEARRLLAEVHGVRDADEAAVSRLVDYLVASGAKARLETRLAELTEESRAALGRVEMTPRARRVLEGAIGALAERER